MNLTPDQKSAVVSWIAAGDNLSAVQKKLSEQFQLSLTYRDVRFLVDDLDLTLKDPAPKVDTSDVSKAAAPKPEPANSDKKSLLEKAKEKLGFGDTADAEPATEEEFVEEDPLPPGGADTVRVTVDKVTLIPGAVASGTVTFSDGVTGKWIVDQYGRPGFTEVSQPGYRPSASDAQGFMRELSRALQQQGY